MKNHPIQPLVKDAKGVLRFQENKIVSHLLDWCAAKNGCVGYNMDTSGKAPDLNELSRMDFSKEDWQQLAQITGYSLSGYGSLSYVDDDAYGAAVEVSKGKSSDAARITHLERTLKAVRKAFRNPIARLYGIHPDNLNG